MSYEKFSTPPPTSSGPRRPPLRAGASYAPIRSFSLPATPTTSTPRRPVVSLDTFRDAEKELYMGALVSPVQMNEKKSIDVPCIILTEPDNYAHPHPHARVPSPPPKQILLLPSTSLALPLHSNSASDGVRRGWLSLARTALVFTAIGLGAWHVWTVLGQFDAEQQLHA